MEDNNDLTMLRQIAQSGRINPSTSTTNSSSEALRPLMEGTLSLYYELNTSNDSSDPSDV